MTNNLPATRRKSWLRDDPRGARPCRACAAKDRNDQQHGSNSRTDLTLAVVKEKHMSVTTGVKSKQQYLSTISELVLTLKFQDEGHKPTVTTLDKSQISPAFKTWPEKRSSSKRIYRTAETSRKTAKNPRRGHSKGTKVLKAARAADGMILGRPKLPPCHATVLCPWGLQRCKI